MDDAYLPLFSDSSSAGPTAKPKSLVSSLWLQYGAALGVAFLLCTWLLQSARTSGVVGFSFLPCNETYVRREWRTLTATEQQDWISAFKCLAQIPQAEVFPIDAFSNYSRAETGTLYDDFVYTHMSLESMGHMESFFLPWHRGFLHVFDMTLRSKCGYDGMTPYWDWSIDAEDLLLTAPLTDDPNTGFGRDGIESEDWAVSSGAFSTNYTRMYPVPHPLRRKLYTFPADLPPDFPVNNATLTTKAVAQALKTHPGDYYAFEAWLQQVHNTIHVFLGGDFNARCPESIPKEECFGLFTVNEPLFWLHHAQIDRIWDLWQHSDPQNFFLLGEQHHIKDHDERAPNDSMLDYSMDFFSLWDRIPVRDVVAINSGELCYAYA